MKYLDEEEFFFTVIVFEVSISHICSIREKREGEFFFSRSRSVTGTSRRQYDCLDVCLLGFQLERAEEK